MLRQNTSKSLALIAGAYLLWFMIHFKDSSTPKLPSDTLTLNAIPGTWTDPCGPRGNQISFILTKIKDEPGDPIALISSAYKTSGLIKDLLGYKDQAFTYGFRSCAPRVAIFVNTDGNQLILGLKATDHNHLRLQVLSKDLNKQKEELGLPPSEPPVDLVREKESDYKPNYR